MSFVVKKEFFVFFSILKDFPMTETFALHIESLAAYAPVWGFFLIFFFMAVESSFIPFPSEVVMIPAGFLAWRGELTFQQTAVDFSLAFLAGLAGSLAGAYVNYFLAQKLGRPFLQRYGKYFFLSRPTLDRADQIFLEYGELATFVCRLLPGIRQLISLPAGLCNMNLKRFTFFTALGAGFWCLVLMLIGAWFGHLTADMTYLQMVEQGTEMIHQNLLWIILGLAIFVGLYMFVHHRIMKTAQIAAKQSEAPEENP